MPESVREYPKYSGGGRAVSGYVDSTTAGDWGPEVGAAKPASASVRYRSFRCLVSLLRGWFSPRPLLKLPPSLGLHGCRGEKREEAEEPEEVGDSIEFEEEDRLFPLVFHQLIMRERRS